MLAFQSGLSQPNTKKAVDAMLKEVRRVSKATSPVVKEVAVSDPHSDDFLSGSFYQVTAAAPVVYAYLGRVQTCRAGGCAVGKPTQKPVSAEYFDYFILFDTTACIISVRVFNYQASHGHEISSRSWLRQFAGHSSETELKVGKNIDTISGATISVNNISSDISWRIKQLSAYLSGNSP